METIWFTVKYNKHYDDVDNISAVNVQDAYDEGESEVVLRLPDCYSETGDAVPLIFTAHGSGGRVCRAEDKTGGLGYVTDCIDGGYAAFDIHGTRPDGRSYGNRRYCEAVFKAYTYILKHYNVEPGLFVAGASMGGVCTLNYVNLYPNTVRCLGLFYPRTNIREVEFAGIRVGGSFNELKKFDSGENLPEIISEQFGFRTPGVWDEERARGLNPWDNRTVKIDGLRYTFLPCPIKIWHGNHDQSVQYVANTEYIAGVRRAGCYAELRTLECTKHKHNDVMHAELKLWFDRFR
ncbi:MAG: alpha/beta hydrolase [Clostridia bacterium]|nr:alpha/beta hydrolase [Clostridia bacterium]